MNGVNGVRMPSALHPCKKARTDLGMESIDVLPDAQADLYRLIYSLFQLESVMKIAKKEYKRLRDAQYKSLHRSFLIEQIQYKPVLMVEFTSKFMPFREQYKDINLRQYNLGILYCYLPITVVLLLDFVPA